MAVSDTTTIPYVDVVARLVAAQVGDSDPDVFDMPLYRLYALLALTVGSNVTLEHVHDAWSVWVAPDCPDHRSLIPFKQLSPDVQELDRPYADAIRATAKVLGR